MNYVEFAVTGRELPAGSVSDWTDAQVMEIGYHRDTICHWIAFYSAMPTDTPVGTPISYSFSSYEQINPESVARYRAEMAKDIRIYQEAWKCELRPIQLQVKV